MAKFSDLPIEILGHIFDDASTTFSPQWHLDLPTPSRALFPFNVASTCTLWLNVLKSKPEYWRQVVIDVAVDPTPLLDMLASFEIDDYDNARIVVVFSSVKDSAFCSTFRNDNIWHEEQKNIENARVRSVFKHLQKSILDWGSITFDVMYQSSLPSLAHLCAHQLPLLHQLTFNCLIHDCDESPVICPGELTFHQLESLQSISMTGASFMELCDCDLHQIFPFNQLDIPDFSVSHFIFHDADQVKAFRKLLSYALIYTNLSLSDLTLAYSSLTEDGDDWYTYIDARHLAFDSVSSEFLEELMLYMICEDTVQIISFQRTSITSNSITDVFRQHLSETFELLQLIDIPYTTGEDSIFNAINSLNPRCVRLLCCKTITDKLLEDLANSECSRMHILELLDCSGFTSGVVRAFVHARQNLHRANAQSNNFLKALAVHGTGPLLSADDAAFFLQGEAGEENDEDPITRVEWNVVGHNNIPDGYTTDLRSADEARPVIPENSLCNCPLVQVSGHAMYTIDVESAYNANE